jgi:hypothetical protein
MAVLQSKITLGNNKAVFVLTEDKTQYNIFGWVFDMALQVSASNFP